MTVREGERIILVGSGREYFVTAGQEQLATDRGLISLGAVIGKEPGDTVLTHSGTSFVIRLPRPTDFFIHGKRSGAPMLPRDIGLVIALTGMNRNDRVLDAGTGSGIAAIYFGGIAREVKTYEAKPDFARIAEKNIQDAHLGNVEVITGDVLTAEGPFDIIHFDLLVRPDHVARAHELLVPGGYLACYTPFIEQMMVVMDAAQGLFSEVTTHELIGREMTRTDRGTRPSTSVCHSGYITIARK